MSSDRLTYLVLVKHEHKRWIYSSNLFSLYDNLEILVSAKYLELTSQSVEFCRAPVSFLYFLFVKTFSQTSTTPPPVSDGTDSAGAPGLGAAQGPRLTGVLGRHGAVRGGFRLWASGQVHIVLTSKHIICFNFSDLYYV